uniref:Uncharacterized protein n=1 Tax=Rhizophora mucronata TaxID=61149 RepID=A0A2P2PBK1_RHIMU
MFYCTLLTHCSSSHLHNSPKISR